ncbi:MAG TPA: hypothetical protein PKW30_04875 [Campylobacterales bacterium]|nr:hypothetical protein [Campylobacterales bacterium]
MNMMFIATLFVSLAGGLAYTALDQSEAAIGIAFFGSILFSFAAMLFFDSKAK